MNIQSWSSTESYKLERELKVINIEILIETIKLDEIWPGRSEREKGQKQKLGDKEVDQKHTRETKRDAKEIGRKKNLQEFPPPPTPPEKKQTHRCRIFLRMSLRDQLKPDFPNLCKYIHQQRMTGKKIFLDH